MSFAHDAKLTYLQHLNKWRAECCGEVFERQERRNLDEALKDHKRVPAKPEPETRASLRDWLEAP